MNIQEENTLNLIKQNILGELKQHILDQNFISSIKQQTTQRTWNNIYQHPYYSLDIAETKQFAYDQQKREWLWYKNLVLPNIPISISKRKLKDQQLNTEQLDNFNINKQFQEKKLQKNEHDLFVKFEDQKQIDNDSLSQEINIKNLRACVFCLRFLDMDKVEDIELVGNQVLELSEDSDATFIGLKFSENSFTSKTNYILLLTTIVSIENFEVFGIKSSPPLLLEARKKSWLRRKNVASLFDVFLPDLIDKQYERIAKDKQLLKGTIKSDVESLMYYFCNPYIRHKILHPFFLLLKFNKAITIYYNERIIKNLQQGSILKNIQKAINEALIEKNIEINQQNLENKPLLLVLQAPSEEKQIIDKVNQYLKVLNGPVLTFYKQEPEKIPKYFQILKYSIELKNEYKQTYNQLQRLKFETGSQASTFDPHQQLLQQQQQQQDQYYYYTQQSLQNYKRYNNYDDELKTLPEINNIHGNQNPYKQIQIDRNIGVKSVPSLYNPYCQQTIQLPYQQQINKNNEQSSNNFQSLKQQLKKKQNENKNLKAVQSSYRLIQPGSIRPPQIHPQTGENQGSLIIIQQPQNNTQLGNYYQPNYIQTYHPPQNYNMQQQLIMEDNYKQHLQINQQPHMFQRMERQPFPNQYQQQHYIQNDQVAQTQNLENQEKSKFQDFQNDSQTFLRQQLNDNKQQNQINNNELQQSNCQFDQIQIANQQFMTKYKQLQQQQEYLKMQQMKLQQEVEEKNILFQKQLVQDKQLLQKQLELSKNNNIETKEQSLNQFKIENN
ncbi:hypothetical protein PPERSA_04761 [Pseudocohnilembus persalinus]|uniref:Uncharacterized protein n=1 Tax=Pseudocohnilembus persalinus TaxID=266149 RepID=A0A0V0QNS5_PSEPJ|nr:hypothetical protein PPERSA_04761 [Pseudocohnilembus persalinus]|eukprot:KRX03883.1 hypothetical protein PPERSA_04761 [Pseudocohnilembus persalinus]